MSATLTASDFLTYFPRVSRLMGDHNVAERIVDLDSLAPTLVRQIEQDLGFLVRRVSEEKVSSAYRHLFQNPDLFRTPRELVPALYEVHAAAMLASVARAVTLTPRVGARRADVMCEIGSHRLFVEVTTYVETWPPPSKNIHEFEFYERSTVERSFNTIPRSLDLQYLDIPASKEVRDRIKTKAGQLPAAELGLVILGAPYSETRDIEAALFGDGYCDFTPRGDAEWGRYKKRRSRPSYSCDKARTHAPILWRICSRLTPRVS